MPLSKQTDEPKPRSDNRMRILRAALRVIETDGVDSVTHRSVDAVANVAAGTTTYHFATRIDLIRQAFALYISDAETALAAALTTRQILTREDLLAFLTGITSLDAENTDLFTTECELLLFSLKDSETGVAVASWVRSLEAWLSDPLERLGAARPVEAARQLIALCRGAEFELMARRQSMTKVQLKDRLNVLLDHFLN